MRSFGAADTEFRIRVNSRSLLGAACSAAGLSDAEGVKKYWNLLDRKSKMSAEEFEKARGDKDPLKEVETASDPKVAEEKNKVMALIETLKSRGVSNIEFDPEIIRGFDYYTGMVFEVSDTSPENPRSLFGGGRYDGLVSLFGGDPIPAVGFAFGDVGFANFLETHGHTPKAVDAPQLFIGTPSESDIPDAQELAQELREKGMRVFVNLTAKGLGDQVKDAVRRGIPYFVACGAQELSSGSFRVKELATGAETFETREEISALARSL
jgi:histidyl-tRNA synthetase